jgi:Rrf2 family protein
MLKLSKKSDYALIAVRHLAAKAPGEACNTREIARAYGIPAELLAKVLQKLVKNGLLVSQHGVDGGYALARHPSLVTAFDVIRAIDGPLLITSCVTPRGACLQSSTCTVREPLSRVNEIIAQALSSVTMSSLGEAGPSMVQIEARP